MPKPSLWRIAEPVDTACRVPLAFLRLQFILSCLLAPYPVFGLANPNSLASVAIGVFLTVVLLLMLLGYWKLHLWPHVLGVGAFLYLSAVLYSDPLTRSDVLGLFRLQHMDNFIPQTLWCVAGLVAVIRVRSRLWSESRNDLPPDAGQS